jgi:hypothetical protein
MVTEEQAIEIYKFKVDLLAKSAKEVESDPRKALKNKIRGESAHFAKMYGIQPRSIRDIWNRRTWGFATRHLWLQENEIFQSEDVYQVNDLKFAEVKLPYFYRNFLQASTAKANSPRRPGRPKGSRSRCQHFQADFISIPISDAMDSSEFRISLLKQESEMKPAHAQQKSEESFRTESGTAACTKPPNGTGQTERRFDVDFAVTAPKDKSSDIGESFDDPFRQDWPFW